MSVSSLKGQVVLITGASSGIGRATAIHFASLGSKLVLCGRNETALQETVDKCEEAADILTVVGDLTVEADVERIMESTIQRYNQLDVLVNNAGITKYASIEKATLEEFDFAMNINLRSVYHLTTLAVPHLIAAKGAIVNVSSLCGIRAYPGLLPYTISKSAVDQFTRCVALELAPKQVRVNSVNPGVIPTNIYKSRGQTEEQYADLLEHSKLTNPLGRVGEPAEVAKAIAFLASSDSSFTTGMNLPIDGGKHAMCPR